MGKNNSLMVQNDDLEVQIQNLKSCGSENEISADEILLLKQHQKQCEDLLITQNNLIENLKEDLEQRKKELQSLLQVLCRKKKTKFEIGTECETIHQPAQVFKRGWKNVDKENGNKNNHIQAQLKEALVNTDKTLFHLKSFFVPFLGTTNLFKEDELKNEIQNLVEQNSALMDKNDNLTVEKDNLIVKLQNLESGATENEVSINEMLMLKQEQEKLNNNLKTQDELIENIKDELVQCNKEIETLRQLNNNLEVELSKRHVESYQDEQFQKKYPDPFHF
ncbi:hypothetical protein FQR65_LT06441 [Abscondita terminalis]|nr:hypothetical protein FQR65_LT06441 [Abscondita terminalis]